MRVKGRLRETELRCLLRMVQASPEFGFGAGASPRRYRKEPCQNVKTKRKHNTRCQARCVPRLGRSCLASYTSLCAVTLLLCGDYISAHYDQNR